MQAGGEIAERLGRIAESVEQQGRRRPRPPGWQIDRLGSPDHPVRSDRQPCQDPRLERALGGGTSPHRRPQGGDGDHSGHNGAVRHGGQYKS